MAMLLPVKVTVAVVVITVVIGFVVKVVARMVTGEDPTVTEALKAVFVALLFNAIAAAAMAKLTGIAVRPRHAGDLGGDVRRVFVRLRRDAEGHAQAERRNLAGVLHRSPR